MKQKYKMLASWINQRMKFLFKFFDINKKWILGDWIIKIWVIETEGRESLAKSGISLGDK